MEISPDLVEWIVADDKVASHWVSLARRLGLSSHVAMVEVKGRRYTTDKHKMAKIMRIWKEQSPDTYTVRTLKNIMAAEGLNDMLMWISMMTQDNNSRREELAEVVYRKLSCPTPRTFHSPSQRATRFLSMRHEGHPTISPMGRHLYSPPPSSPYSIYFSGQMGFNRDYSTERRIQPYPSSSYNRGSSSYSCFDSLSTSRQSTPDSTSRPTSRLSEYGYINPSPTLGSSCPGTPLQRRPNNKSSFSRSPALDGRSSSNWTPGPSSSTHCDRTRSTSPAKGVFDLLYRPDLIKMSSPYTRNHQSTDHDDLSFERGSLVIEEPRYQHPKQTNGSLEHRKHFSNEKQTSLDNSTKKSYQSPASGIKKENYVGAQNKNIIKKLKFETTELLNLSENGVQSMHMDLNIQDGEEHLGRRNKSKINDSFGIYEGINTRDLSEKTKQNKNKFTKPLQHDSNSKFANNVLTNEGVKQQIDPKNNSELTLEMAKQNVDSVIEGLQKISTNANQEKNIKISNTKKQIISEEKQTYNKIDHAISNIKYQHSDHLSESSLLRPKTPEPVATVPSLRKGGNNTMDTYFDNLIVLLDEAAEGLNV